MLSRRREKTAMRRVLTRPGGQDETFETVMATQVGVSMELEGPAAPEAVTDEEFGAWASPADGWAEDHG
jgi:hypothetical protein